MPNDILKKVKLLRTIRPSAEWKKTSREILMMQIKNTLDVDVDIAAAKKENVTFSAFKLFFPYQVFKTALRPVLAVLLIFGLVLGGGLSVSAAEFSLPGDRLYPLKLAAEKIQVSLTFNEEKKTKMHVELAGKRINEVVKIKEQPTKSQGKGKKINIAVDGFKKEMEIVKTKLEALEQKVEPQKVVEVAQVVDTKANEYQGVLIETQEQIEDSVKEEITSKINEGIKTVEKAGDTALGVIVENHTKGEVVLPEEEIIQRLENKIEIAENKVNQVEKKIESLGESKNDGEESGEDIGTEGDENEESDGSEISESTQLSSGINGVTDQATESLDQAKELLSQKDMSGALEKVMDGKELTKQAEEKVIEAAQEEASASSTEETNIGEDKDTTNINTNTTNTNTNPTNTNVNVNTNTSEDADADADSDVDETMNASTTNINADVDTNSEDVESVDASEENVNVNSAQTEIQSELAD